MTGTNKDINLVSGDSSKARSFSGKKSYKELTKAKWSSGAPSVTREGGFARRREMQTSKNGELKEKEKKKKERKESS